MARDRSPSRALPSSGPQQGAGTCSRGTGGSGRHNNRDTRRAAPWGWTPPGMSGYPRPVNIRRASARGLLRILFPVALILLLGGSIWLNVNLLGSGSKKSVVTTIITAGDSHKQIAVIPLDGLIDEAQVTIRFEAVSSITPRKTPGCQGRRHSHRYPRRIGDRQRRNLQAHPEVQSRKEHSHRRGNGGMATSGVATTPPAPPTTLLPSERH